MKLAFFDLEISFEDLLQLDQAKEAEDIWQMFPFGISIGALHRSFPKSTDWWYDIDENGQPLQAWRPSTVNRFVSALVHLRQTGYRIFTWNGTGFDYQLLARLAPQHHATIVNLCRHSYDPCFQMLAQVGYPVGLDTAAKAIGASSKEMEGWSAPLAWATGQYDMVKRYVKGDVERLAAIVDGCIQNKGLKWRPKKGGVRFQDFERGFLTVGQCLALPEPDLAWMEKAAAKTGEPLKRTTKQEVVQWW